MTTSIKEKITYRCGKQLDFARLKSNVLEDPAAYLKQIEKRVALYKNPRALVKVKNCYICGSKGPFNPVLKVWDVTFVQCPVCTHTFLPARISDKAMEEFYRKNKFYAATYANADANLYRKENVAKPKVEHVLDIAGAGRALRWLDVGTGTGEIVAVLREKGIEAYGLELSKHSVEFAKRAYGLDLIPQTLQQYSKQKPQLFDVISFMGVLEHVADPVNTLGAAVKLLKKGGYIAAEVPNFNCFSTRVQAAFPRNVIRHAEPLGHMQLFTEQSMKYALRRFKLVPRNIWYFGMDMHELIFNLTIQDPSFAGHPIRHSLYESLNDLQGIIDRSKLSDEFLVVAQKK